MKFRLFLLFCLFGQLSLNAQTLKYTNGNNAWNPDSLGNHRVVLQFQGAGKIAHAKIDWRRRDEHPELKGIIIQDANGKQVSVVGSDNLTQGKCRCLFRSICCWKILCLLSRL